MKNSQKGSASLTAVVLASFLLSLGGVGSGISLFRQNPDQFFAELRTYAQKLSNITLTDLPTLSTTIGISPTSTPDETPETTPEPTPTVTQETTPTPTVSSTPSPTPTPDASDEDDNDDEKEERRGDKEHRSRRGGLGIFMRGEQKLRQFLKFQFKVEAREGQD